MTNEITGTIEAVSQNYSGGLLIGGTWYNGTKANETVVKAQQKNAVVTLTLDDKGKIANITPGGTPSPVQPQQPATAPAPVQQQAPPTTMQMSADDKAVVINAEVEKYSKLMELCRNKTVEIFGEDERFKDSMGQHCNSLFIALDRRLKERGIIL